MNAKPKIRGMAMAMTVVVIGVLAVVLTAVAAHLAVDLRRAEATADATQASRLIAAAKEIARAQIVSANPVDGPVETPVGTLTFAWQGAGDVRTCAVTAKAGGVRREASLTFDRSRLTAVK